MMLTTHVRPCDRRVGTLIVAMLSTLLAAGLFGTGAWSAPARTTAPQAENAPAVRPPPLDEEAIARRYFGNDAPWYRNNIPYFESSDQRLDRVYYYRWQLYRAHQRDLGTLGYVTTEFLDDVEWQRQPYATISAAMHHHINEGRWLRDRRYLNDYIGYMYDRGGIDGRYTEAVADAVWGRFAVDGDRNAALKHLNAMKRVYAAWDNHYDAAKGLYWIEPIQDATENTIGSIDASGGIDGFTGGDAFRPSINSYMFANARAISRLAAMAGDAQAARAYAAKARDLRRRVQRSLWHQRFQHFVDRYKVANRHVRYWDFIRGRELVGFVPWAFGLPADDVRSAVAWTHLTNPDRFAGRAGPRTVEPSYEHYMRQYRFDPAGTGRPECQWNGPVWPYQITQVLVGLANFLNDYRHRSIGRADYARLLHRYADLHHQGDRLDLEEDYYPDTGRPIVGLERSHHYNHSAFADLIISGLVGLRPRADDVLEVNPLAPVDAKDPHYLRYFALQDVPYHGRLVTIVFDADGSRYRRGAGLRVLVDEVEVARAPTLSRLTVRVARKPVRLGKTRANLAMGLNRNGYPKASASINAEPEKVHDAIDGRVWFFTEAPNGWTTAGSRAQTEWFAVDLGKPTRVRSAELAFASDNGYFAAPRTFRLQAWMDGDWRNISGELDAPLANGITHARWKSLITSRMRVLVEPQRGRATRLVELRLF